MTGFIKREPGGGVHVLPSLPQKLEAGSLIVGEARLGHIHVSMSGTGLTFTPEEARAIALALALQAKKADGQ